MPRRPALFTQADLARVLRAARDAGVRVRVRLLPDGSMEVLPISPDEPQDVPASPIERRPPRVLIS